MDNKLGQAPAQLQKHIGIHGSIERLAQVNRNIGSLIEEIAGHGPAPTEACTGMNVKSEPSLLEILNESGNEIASLSENINDNIAELRAMLF